MLFRVLANQDSIPLRKHSNRGGCAPGRWWSGLQSNNILMYQRLGTLNEDGRIAEPLEFWNQHHGPLVSDDLIRATSRAVDGPAPHAWHPCPHGYEQKNVWYVQIRSHVLFYLVTSSLHRLLGSLPTIFAFAFANKVYWKIKHKRNNIFLFYGGNFIRDITHCKFFTRQI